MDIKKSSRRALARAALLALCAATGPAMALDYNGYLRAGPGLTSGNNSTRACYGLKTGSPGMTYRLGNECDFYGEFQLRQGFKKDGIEYAATLMVNHHTPATQDNPDRGLAIEQMYAEARGFDIAPEALFWAGKERGRRGDVHIVDTFFVEMRGVGAGFRELPVGPGRLGLSYYRTDSDAERPGNRLNLEYTDIASNASGALHVFGTATQGDFDGGTKGLGLTLRHDQQDLLGPGSGVNNMLWLQFSSGSAALNANFGDLTRANRNKGWRIVESVNWQRGAFGGQLIALYASEKDAQGLKATSTTLGGRLSYGVTRNFKLLGEAGVSRVKPQGGEAARLTKVTFAPTLSVGPGLFDRPEFRLYVTHGRWNRAAGNVTGRPAFDNETSGTSYGAQVEWWF
jgi:maltoporin